MEERKIAHFRILEKIGSGGMGSVYKAVDERLDRFVALKFLSRDLNNIEVEKERFIKEARAASSLDHNNICTIYDIGETTHDQIYIAMAFYQGRILREIIDEGPLSIEKAVDISIQIAAGMDAAHDHGIIHRDLKPGNILITEDGVVKILDFGLAKLKDQKELTQKGVLLGTLDYMSPELFETDTIDKQSDVWSLGVIMYEMLTGQKPFRGESEQAIMHSILNKIPPAVSRVRQEIPTWLDQLVQKTLAKDAAIRLESMAFLKNRLSERRGSAAVNLGKKQSTGKDRRFSKSRWMPILSGFVLVVLILLIVAIFNENGFLKKKKMVSVGEQASIAVLPFKDISSSRNQAFFCDGMAEELIYALSKVDGLKVTSGISSAYFKGKELDIRDIGNKLNVNIILEGSVRKAGNKLRISAQLINVADGYHIWSERYDRDLKDVFAIQDEIAGNIVNILKIKLTKRKRAALFKRYTRNIEAYNSYMKGRHFWNRRFPEDLAKGVEYFKQAIKIDPDYALAHVGLADSYHLMTSYTMIPPKKAFPLARVSAQRALAIDQELGEAHNSLAAVKLLFDWDWQGAEEEFKKALELSPNYVTAHEWYAIYLAIQNRLPEALKQMRLAVKLDPLSTSALTGVARHLYFSRQYDQAMQQFKKVLEVDPNCFYAMAHMGQTLIQLKKYPQAEAVFQKAVLLTGQNQSGVLAGLAFTHAVSGNSEAARKILAQLVSLSEKRYVPAFYFAAIFIALKDKERVFEWLEKAYQERSEWLIYLGIEPILDPISAEPEFKDLLQRVGLKKIR